MAKNQEKLEIKAKSQSHELKSQVKFTIKIKNHTQNMQIRKQIKSR
jgi:hypothetical protein